MAVSSFSGLASGLDTASIVKELVKLERLPITRLEQQKTGLNAISTKFSNFKDLIGKLKDAATGLKGRSDLLASVATSGDEKLVTAKADGAAAIGNYDLKVTQLASSQRNRSEAFATKTESGVVSSGDLTIQVGTGEAVSITVDANASLASLATDINRAGAGVTAAVLFSNGEYRLQISGNTTGAANTLTFGGTAAAELGLDANVVRDAKDAEFELDGLPMTSASNTVTEALDGVTLTLKGLTEGTSVEVSRDNDAIKTKLQGFVDAYNEIAKQITSEFSYKGTAQTQSSGSLSGDSGLRSVQARLRSMIGTQIDVAGSGFNTLASIGLRTQQDGTLKIDDKILTDALANAPEKVAQLLVDEPGKSTGMFGQFETVLKDMVSGDGSVIAQRISSIAGRVKNLDSQMSRMELRIDSYQTKITLQFSQMESAMSKLQNQGSQLNAMMASL